MSQTDADTRGFPVVGIGASAGGLEALTSFFKAVTPDSGMAYVVVMHLDPDHDSNVASLLSKTAGIPVEQATDGVRVQPNHGYILPPGHNMRYEDGALRLDASRREGRPLVVDILFDSLAQELGSRAAAVILSGTGTDGSNGIKKIKAGEGVVLAQSLKTASYTGMPQSAMDTGVVDVAAAPERMPDKLQQHFLNEESHEEQDEQNGYALSKIFAILFHKLGHDFSDHKETTLRRRLQRRLTFNEIASYEDYLPVLRQNRQEAQALFREFLIGVTHFFRDPESLEALKRNVIPDLIETANEGETLRVWVAGCSTGEEAYSIAIIFHEVMDAKQKTVRLQIFGTDLDEQAVETARSGLYPSSIAADVDEARLSKFFRKEGEKYRVRKDIRESIVFSGQDLLSDPPFSRLHMVCCRNVLIYLKPRAQRRLLPLFHYTLNQGGILVLGSSESIGSHTALFDAVNQKQKIFQKKEVSAQVRGELKFPTGVGKLERGLPGAHDDADDQGKSKSTAELTQRVLLDEFAPTAVLVEPDGRIIHIQGKTGRYLEAVTGPPTYNILDLAKQGLRLEIASALRAARTDGKPIDRREIRVRNQDTREIVDLHVRPLSKPDELAGRVLIVFQDREEREETKGDSESREQLGDGEHESRIAELETELLHTRESHQSTVEELESANEELKSTNEELQSTNEELQSTNEENESSKEELHALNEELQTANDQLEQKMTDLNAVNDDIRNLLNSTDVASVFVDEQMNVRRFTPEATRIINLIDSDIGRPLADFATRLRYHGLTEDVRRATSQIERQERDVQTEEGTWYRLRVVPYRTSDDRIDGAVLTFINIDEQKRMQHRLENSLNEARAAWTALREVASTVDEPVAILDREQRVEFANEPFALAANRPQEALNGVPFVELAAGDDSSTLATELREAAEGDAARTIEPVQLDGKPQYKLFAVPVSGPERDSGKMLVRLRRSADE